MLKLKKFRSSAGAAAIAAVIGGAGLAGYTPAVQAVNLAHDGVGQVLIYPYYTVRDGWGSYFSVTNTSNKTVVAKVRWREAVNSREVRDFNIILSPYDVWTAATVTTKDGAQMLTTDKSCTVPALLPGGADNNGVPIFGIPFTSLAYTDNTSGGGKNNDDGGTTSRFDSALDRTREGYFTIIEMGVANDKRIPQTHKTASKNEGSVGEGVVEDGDRTLGELAKHDKTISNNEAFPADMDPATHKCTLIQAISGGSLAAAKITEYLEPPENVLAGQAIMIRPRDGMAAGYNPAVLANFSDDVIYYQPSLDLPNLGNSSDLASWIQTKADGTLEVITDAVPSDYGYADNKGEDAVSLLFEHSTVMNDYNVRNASATDWIMTFPTKRYYTDESSSAFAGMVNQDVEPEIITSKVDDGDRDAPKYPFNTQVEGERFNKDKDGKSCFNVDPTVYDREEYKNFTPDTDLGFSPSETIGSVSTQLCYEANVMSFGDQGSLFESKVRKTLTSLPGDYGWAKIGFGKDGDARLPVLGFRAEARNNGSVAANYGFAHDHYYQGVPVPATPTSP